MKDSVTENDVSFIPRRLVFDKQTGKCLGAGIASHHYSTAETDCDTISLPTDHYDWLGYIDPVGMTKKEILKVVSVWKKGCDYESKNLSTVMLTALANLMVRIEKAGFGDAEFNPDEGLASKTSLKDEGGKLICSDELEAFAEENNLRQHWNIYKGVLTIFWSLRDKEAENHD